jgi:uncharacterized membrane protein
VSPGTQLPEHRPAGRERGVLARLLISVVIVAVVALIGFILLETVKFAIVITAYAVGAALIAVPLVLARGLVRRGHDRRDRWGRIGIVTALVCGGIALILVAHFVAGHGWLLIVLPAAATALAVGVHRVRDRLARRRDRRLARAAAQTAG